MAQDPLKPLDDGKIALPKVDSAMVKRAPTAPPGAKDDKGPLRPGKDKKDDRKDDEILAKARKRLDRCIQAESENRKNALDDLKFKSGEGQWPADVQSQRNFDNRPCLTINKLKTFVHQVTNDQRQNRPAININPVGDRGDPEVAKMFAGLIRFLDRNSEADIAYDTAFDNAVSNGFGYWRTITEYSSPDSFDQLPVVKRVRNPFTIYLDPDHQEPDGADARFGFVTENIPRSEFKDRFPGAQEVNHTQAGVGDSMKNWVAADTIRIAEYFEVEYEKRTLVALSNGHVGWKDELHELALETFEIEKERESEVPRLWWYKLSAVEILERQEWLGKWIPIVKVIGDEIDIEGKVKLSGIIRDAKGPQLMYNYFRTLSVELQALQPKAPWIGAEGQFEGYETQWKQANTKSYPYLEYRPVDVDGKPAPPPQRQQMTTVTQGADMQAQISAQDMMATTGIRFDATPQDKLYDESGRALREHRRSGDLGSFHYVDNLARSLRQQGEIYLDLIPKVMDTKQIVTILREDGAEEQVQLDPAAAKPFQEGKHPATGKMMKIFNPTIGRYGVTVTIGPSYATKRIEAAESMMDFARALPNAAALIMDLIAKNQDWPGADEMATRLAKAIPPQFLAPEVKDVPPQVQAIMAAMDKQIKELTAQLQQAMAALTSQTADREQRERKIQHDFEAKLMNIVAQVETKMAAVDQKREDSANRHVGSHVQKLAEEVTAVRDVLENPPEMENINA